MKFKLDIIVFARLISFVSNLAAYNFSKATLTEIYDMIEFEVPEPQPNKVDRQKLDGLLFALKEVNSGKLIEAIKCYRELTGCALLEAKNAIEQFRHNN